MQSALTAILRESNKQQILTWGKFTKDDKFQHVSIYQDTYWQNNSNIITSSHNQRTKPVKMYPYVDRIKGPNN